MSGGLLSAQNISVKFDKVNWPTLVNGPNYIARESSVSFPPTGANIKSEKAGELQGVCYSWELSQTRTSLVNSEQRAIQWQPQMTIKQMLSQKGGEHIAMESQQGEMVKERTGTPHKCFRTNGCKICNPDFPKKSLKFNCLYPDGQQNCPIASLENGGYAQSRASKNQQVNLELSAISWDHNYCRIFTKQVECPSRLGVSECQGLLRLETASKNVSEHNQTFWISNSGPLSIQAVPSTSTICSMETQSKQHSNRCNATVLEQNVFICFPPFQSGKLNSEEGLSRKGKTNDNSYTNMTNTTLVSSSVRDVNAMPTSVDTTARSTARSSKK